jgi:hypothetical protein
VTCPDCTKAESHPHWGGYTASCPKCQARLFGHALPLHLGNLKTIPASQDRRAYIDTVERQHGKEAADRLKAAFAQWWEGQRAAKAAKA